MQDHPGWLALPSFCPIVVEANCEHDQRVSHPGENLDVGGPRGAKAVPRGREEWSSASPWPLGEKGRQEKIKGGGQVGRKERRESGMKEGKREEKQVGQLVCLGQVVRRQEGAREIVKSKC